MRSKRRKLEEETAARGGEEGGLDEVGAEGGVLQMPEDVVVVDGEGVKRVERVSWVGGVEVGVGGREGEGGVGGVDAPPPAYTSIYSTGRVVA